MENKSGKKIENSVKADSGSSSKPPQLLFKSFMGANSPQPDVSKPTVTGNFINHDASTSYRESPISLPGITYSDGGNLLSFGDDSSDSDSDSESIDKKANVPKRAEENSISEKQELKKQYNETNSSGIGSNVESGKKNTEEKAREDSNKYSHEAKDNHRKPVNNFNSLAESLEKVQINVVENGQGDKNKDNISKHNDIDSKPQSIKDTGVKVDIVNSEKKENLIDLGNDLSNQQSPSQLSADTNENHNAKSDNKEKLFSDSEKAQDKGDLKKLEHTTKKPSITTESKDRIINRVQKAAKSKQELKAQEKTIQEDKIKNEQSRSKLKKQDPNNLPFDFQRFLSYLKSKSADSIVKYLKSFLIAFSKKNWTVSEQVKLITDFKNFIYDKMATVQPFANMNETEFINCQEGMEKLIMNRLYDQVFSPVIHESKLDSSHREDIAKDELLTNQILRFSWVTNQHLDLEEEFIIKGKSFFQLAISELIKINNYRSPRDKIICILNCCKVIFAMLKHSSKETNADAFIPTLIYVVLKTDEDLRLNSNISYIERFRNEDGLAGEVSYYLSSFWAVIGFIENLNKESLTISQEEWDSHMKPFEETNTNEIADLNLQKKLQKRKEQKENKKAVQEPSNKDLDELVPGLSSGSEDGLLKNALSPASLPIGNIFSPFQSIQSFFQSVSDDGGNGSNDGLFLDDAASSPAARHNVVSSALSQESQNQQSSKVTNQGDEQDRHLEKSKKQSRAEFLAQQAFEEESKQLIDQLESMFPGLDKEIIKDIVVMNKARASVSVDACLALSGA